MQYNSDIKYLQASSYHYAKNPGLAHNFSKIFSDGLKSIDKLQYKFSFTM